MECDRKKRETKTGMTNVGFETEEENVVNTFVRTPIIIEKTSNSAEIL